MSESNFNISLFTAVNEAKEVGRGQWLCSCPCPAHDDKRPSFVVKENSNSMFGYQYQCLSGRCTSEEITDALIKQGVITTKKGNSKPYSPVPEKFKDDLLTTYYEYTNEDGETIGFVGRYENGNKKQTIPFFGRPDEDWKYWKAGLNKFLGNSVKPVYNLHNAVKSNEVWVVEGEKSVDALRKLKICAVTNIGGSKAVKFVDWSFLQGKEVVIWRDYDDAGAHHTFNLTKIFKKLDISFKLVDTAKIANKVAEIKGEDNV